MHRILPLALLLCPLTALAQPNAGPLPHPVLGTVFPCGGRAGTTVEIACAGTDLDRATALLFSTSGLSAEPIAQLPDVTDAAPRRPPGNPPPPPPQRFRVTIAADTPLGIHDVRIVTPLGVSNPRAFVVGALPEVVEREPNDDVPLAQTVALESVVHGVIATSTDVDYFRFPGKAGQRVLMHCQAASVDSRLDPALELYDGAGQRLGMARRYFETDALLDVTLPADGEYTLRVFAFTYTRGDTTTFYRLTLSTGPWIDAAFPTVLEPGRPTSVTLFGRNLPGGKPDPAAMIDGRALESLVVTVTAPADPVARQQLTTTGLVPPRSATVDGFEYRLPGANPVLFTFATDPVITEAEPNDTLESAQTVTLPGEIAGRIDRKNDRDFYRFRARKGEVVAFDLIGDRLNSANDFYLSLRDARGRELLESDDAQPNDLLSQFHFNNRAGDPSPSRFTMPQDGEYVVMVGARDSATVFGVQSAYRLRIGSPRPDFRLIAVPSLDNTPNTQQGSSPDALTLPRGGQQYLDLYIHRRDGFASPITVMADGLPPGVTCPPQTIPPNARQAAIVLRAAADAPAWAGPIRLIAKATVDRQELVREVRPGGVVWPLQRGNLTLARIERALVASVRDAGPYRIDTPATELVVQQGDSVKLPLKLTRTWDKCQGEVKLYLMNIQPNVISLNGATFAADQTEIEAELTPRSGTPPGVYQIALVGKPAPFAVEARDAMGRMRPTQIAPRYPAPPVTLTVVPASVAILSVTAPPRTVSAGGTAEAIIRVRRQFEYAGEFRLTLAEANGVTMAETVLPAGKDEVRATLSVAADAKPGPRVLVLQAIAPLAAGITASHEAKFNINVK
ncbi:MAG: PPC domain-containing protein [Gemmataceae bacterium]